MSTSKRKAPPLPVGRRREVHRVAVFRDGQLAADSLGGLSGIFERCSPDANLERLLAHFERLATAVLGERAVRAHEQNRHLAEDIAEIVPRTRQLAARLSAADRADLFDAIWLAMSAQDIEHDLAFSREFHAGVGTQQGGHKGADAAHGTITKREAEREGWRRRFADLRARFPEAQKKALLGVIASETGETFRTLRRYIKQR